MPVAKILLVDDDVELCNELAEMLRDEGYDVDNTSDPFAGVTLIEHTAYDAVLVDFKMPGLNGFDLLVKAKEKIPRAARFLVTGRPFFEIELEQEFAPGVVTEVIPKPFNVAALLATLRNMP